MHQKTINLKKKLQTTNTVIYIFCLIINLAIIWILFFLFQLRSCKEFASHAEIFRKKSVTRDEVAQAGEKLLLLVFGNKSVQTMDELRHVTYKKTVTNKVSVYTVYINKYKSPQQG